MRGGLQSRRSLPHLWTRMRTLFPQCTNVVLKHHSFYVDTGATGHLSQEQDDFLTLHPISPHSVKGVGGSLISVISVGDIKLKIVHGASITLKDALCVPDAAVHLISCSMKFSSQ